MEIKTKYKIFFVLKIAFQKMVFKYIPAILFERRDERNRVATHKSLPVYIDFQLS